MKKVKNKIYWQSFGDLSKSKNSQKIKENEFQEELPKDFHTEGAYSSSRRDFLKVMGFSTLAATLASCDTYVRKAVAFLNRPDQEVPGIPNYYATTYRQNAEVIPIVAKTREGRPIKIEGNKLSGITNGATSARVQASVLDLYNTQRLKYPSKSGKEMATFTQADEEISAQLSRLNPSEIALVTHSVSSPSSQRVIDEFALKYKGSTHIQSDAISYSAMLLANEMSFAKRFIPYYELKKADVIVSFSADFLGTWLTPVAFSSSYATRRKLNKASENSMSRHIQFESIMTLTGSNADARYTHKYSQTGTLLYDLLETLKGNNTFLTQDIALQNAIKKVSAELIQAKGRSVVLCGTNRVKDQAIVNEINQLIDAYSEIINVKKNLLSVQGVDTDIKRLIDDIRGNKIKAVLFAGANPVYNHPLGNDLKDAMQKLSLSVSMHTFENETAEACTYIIPTPHYLESWDDEQIVSDEYAFTQPTIVPLFKTRQWQDSLLTWLGNTSKYEDLIEQYWVNKLGSSAKWKECQQQGIATIESASPALSFKSNNSFSSSDFVSSDSGNELVIYQKIAVGEGDQIGNPWLQEMPDPITKATWGNYLMMSMDMAKKILGIDLTKTRDADAYEVNVNKPVVKIKIGADEIKLPVLIIPGMEKQTVAMALGYGRNDKMGIAAREVGKSAFPFLKLVDGATYYSIGKVEIVKTDEKAPVALTQSHHSYEGRAEAVKETSLTQYKKNPAFFKADKERLTEEYAPKTEDFAKEGTLYGAYPSDGIHWGMSVDLNACIGCGSCVVACSAENNVAVVGKEEVLRGHEMHWMRIDRYFSGDDANDPQVTYQPMMCQHCDNAPCENVCPVSATNHSSEGLNQMIYNRCVGTRYCENNCPYKVRRFNWADYLGGDAVSGNQEAVLSAASLDMNDELTRMVLNPDVSVRSRGVMEKCSFCAQRLQAAKLKAKEENRPLGDEVETACMQACPTQAIVFGNILDKKNKINGERENDRTYRSLEQLHALPNVSYLGKVRNA